MRIALGAFSALALAALTLTPSAVEDVARAAVAPVAEVSPARDAVWGLPSPHVRLEPPHPQHSAVALYVLQLMYGWRHPFSLTADYDAIAESIATASEQDARPYEAARLLVTIAFMESGFMAYVDDGRCNLWARKAYRLGRDVSTGVTSPLTGKMLTRREPDFNALGAEANTLMHGGSCDNGLAVSIFQIHPFGDVTAEQLADRTMAARVALRLLRFDSTLIGYTGESHFFHPKADARLRVFEAAGLRHPAPSL